MRFIRVEYRKKAGDISNRRFKSYTYGPIQCDQQAGTKAKVMRFLLRMAFWLTIILALLPSGGSQPTPNVNVSTLEAMSAAKATVTDMGSFCGRQPDACSVGSQAAVAIGHRAQAGAKMVYDYLKGHFGSQDAGTATNAGTSNGPPIPTPRPSQHTLSPADLAPVWRGPQIRKEARGDRQT